MNLKTTSSRNRTSTSGRVTNTLAVLGLVVLWVAFFRPIWDVDIFWHIAAGRWIWDHKTLPSTDIFSAVDPTRPWYTFQWLYEVGVYFLDQWGGLLLVRVVSVSVVLAAFVLWYRRFRSYLGPHEIVFFVLALLAVLYSDRVRVRPHIVNFLFMAILVPLFWGAWRNHVNVRGFARIAVYVGLWANLHAGGALMFIAALLAIPVGEWVAMLLQKHRIMVVPEPRPKAAFLLWFVAVGTAVIMPHFVSGNITAITMLDASRPLIEEWMVPWGYIDRFVELRETGKIVVSLLVTGVAPYVACVGLVVTIIAMITRRRVGELLPPIHPTEWLLAGGASLIAMSSARFSWWSILTFAIIIRAWTVGRPLRPNLKLAAIISTLLFVVVGWQRYFSVMAGSFTETVNTMHQDIDERRFPVTAADFLEAAKFEGNIWCLPNWGGYLLWRLHPQVSVLADGRGNFDHTVSSELQLVYEQRFAESAYDAVVSAYGRIPNIDAIVIQPPGFGPKTPPIMWKTMLKTRREEIYYRVRPENQANIGNAELLQQAIEKRMSDIGVPDK